MRLHISDLFLLSKTKTQVTVGLKYSLSRELQRFCINQVVQEFTAHIAVHDRQVRWEEFICPTPSIQIMIATTVLGTGIDIADVKRVVA